MVPPASSVISWTKKNVIERSFVLDTVRRREPSSSSPSTTV
jgi:hypothetical protein